MNYKLLTIINFQLSIILLCVFLSSCGGKTDKNTDEERHTTTPVTVTHCAIGDMEDVAELNATSAFLQKNAIKAITNGYVKSVAVLPGQRVAKGQVLFVLKGKEAENLGSTINELDTAAHFTGVSRLSFLFLLVPEDTAIVFAGSKPFSSNHFFTLSSFWFGIFKIPV